MILAERGNRMYLVKDGSHTTDTFKTLAEAKFDLLVRYCHFSQDMEDCYFTPAKSEKQLNRDKSFEFYGLKGEDQPDYSRKFYATIEKIAA